MALHLIAKRACGAGQEPDRKEGRLCMALTLSLSTTPGLPGAGTLVGLATAPATVTHGFALKVSLAPVREAD